MKDNQNKKNPFSVPENYFENFGLDLEIKMAEQKIADFFGKKNPFAVPENYFQNKGNEIKNIARNKIFNTTSKKLFYWFSSAVAVLIIILLVSNLFTTNNDKKAVSHNTGKSVFDNFKINFKTENKDDVIEVYSDIISEDIIVETMNEEPTNSTISEEDEKIIEYLADYTDDADLLADL